MEFLPTIADYLVNKHEKRIAEFGARVILQAVDEEIKIPLAKAILTAEHHQKTGLVFHLADKNNKVIVT